MVENLFLLKWQLFVAVPQSSHKEVSETQLGKRTLLNKNQESNNIWLLPVPLTEQVTVLSSATESITVRLLTVQPTWIGRSPRVCVDRHEHVRPLGTKLYELPDWSVEISTESVDYKSGLVSRSSRDQITCLWLQRSFGSNCHIPLPPEYALDHLISHVTFQQ